MLTYIVLHDYQVAQFMFNFNKGYTTDVAIDVLVYNFSVQQCDARKTQLIHILKLNEKLFIYILNMTNLKKFCSFYKTYTEMFLFCFLLSMYMALGPLGW